MNILKMIREFLQNQKFREYIGAIAAVNELQEKVDQRNSLPSNQYMPFFQNETDALKYTKEILNTIIEK